MLGLMQDWSLTVDKIIDHAKNWHGDREVVTRSVEGPVVRSTYSDIHRRARPVSHGLLELVQPGGHERFYVEGGRPALDGPAD